MHHDEPQTTTGEDADFRKLLRDLFNGRETTDALLINPVFQRRVPSICQTVTRNAFDADDLANHVRLVVCDKFHLFEPKYEKPYGNFFNWVTRIARNKVIDDYRRRMVRPEDELDETYVVEDLTVDIEADAERRETIERFWSFVGELDPVTQKIMHYHLEDYSLREIEEKLAAEGIKMSHVAIGNAQKRVVADFFARENTRNATMIVRKGQHQSRGREKGDPPSARKTGS